MRQLVIDVPEKVLLAEKKDESTFAREMHILSAVKLYELGRLSSGRAADLAGMSRVEFLLELGRREESLPSWRKVKGLDTTFQSWMTTIGCKLPNHDMFYGSGSPWIWGMVVDAKEEWLDWEKRIVLDPEVLVGKPVVKGTRLAVDFVIDLLAQGWSESEILRNYPGLTREDIKACLGYASASLRAEKVYPMLTV